MAYEWQRFMWWLQQGQNATAVQAIAAVLVAAVTVWYAFLTHWIMKATGKQASAALQPELAMSRLDGSQDKGVCTIIIENKSARPIVFLDIMVHCHPMGHGHISHRLGGWDERILAAGDHAMLPLDFTDEIVKLRVQPSMCGLGAVVVVSDLSRHVAITYDFAWTMGRFAGHVGIPFKVKWRYRLQPLRWRYYRVVNGLQHRFKNSD